MSLEEQSVWEEEVHELGVAERALGGRGGVSNRQAQQLANRTKYLRDAIAQLQNQQIASLDINEVGHLIVTLGDASQVDLGVVVGPQGVGMPAGGLIGQVPVKTEIGDYVFGWVDLPVDGQDGVSVTGVAIDEAGHLIITLSNGGVIDAGFIPSGGGSDWSGDWNMRGAYPITDGASIAAAFGKGYMPTIAPDFRSFDYLATGGTVTGGSAVACRGDALSVGFQRQAGRLSVAQLNLTTLDSAYQTGSQIGFIVTTSAGAPRGYVSIGSSGEEGSGSWYAYASVNGSQVKLISRNGSRLAAEMAVYLNGDTGVVEWSVGGVDYGAVPGFISVNPTDRLSVFAVVDDTSGIPAGARIAGTVHVAHDEITASLPGGYELGVITAAAVAPVDSAAGKEYLITGEGIFSGQIALTGDVVQFVSATDICVTRKGAVTQAMAKGLAQQKIDQIVGGNGLAGFLLKGRLLGPLGTDATSWASKVLPTGDMTSVKDFDGCIVDSGKHLEFALFEIGSIAYWYAGAWYSYMPNDGEIFRVGKINDTDYPGVSGPYVSVVRDSASAMPGLSLQPAQRYALQAAVRFVGYSFNQAATSTAAVRTQYTGAGIKTEQLIQFQHEENAGISIWHMQNTCNILNGADGPFHNGQILFVNDSGTTQELNFNVGAVVWMGAPVGGVIANGDAVLLEVFANEARGRALVRGTLISGYVALL